jgi:integrase
VVTAKVVQHRLGHSSITVTLDTYGYLFPTAMMVRSWQKRSAPYWGDLLG